MRNEEVKRTFQKSDGNYVILKKQVQANHDWINAMTAAAEMLYIFLEEQVEVDRERVSRITIAMEKLRRKSKRKRIIIPLANKCKLTTRRSNPGERRSCCMLYMNGTHERNNIWYAN